MEDSSDEENQTQTTNENETGRVARFFLYKNRERQSVRKPQLKPVLDEFREKSRKKRVDPIKSANTMLKESMGLQIVEGTPPGEKPSQSAKHFLIRTHKYPKDCPIPFTSEQKQEVGLLIFCFFIVHYKGNLVEMEQIWQILESSGVPSESDVFGKWPEIMNKWISQDYFRAKKKDDDNSPIPKRLISLGPRFYAEFSEETLVSMAKELVCDITPEENEKEDEKENEEEEDKGEKKTEDENSEKEENDNDDDEDSIEEEQQSQKEKQTQKKDKRKNAKSQKSQKKKGRKGKSDYSDIEESD